MEEHLVKLVLGFAAGSFCVGSGLRKLVILLMTPGKTLLFKDRNIVCYFIIFAKYQQNTVQLKCGGESWYPGYEKEHSFETSFEACLALLVVVFSSYSGDIQYSKYLGSGRIIYLCIVGFVKEKI